jgi:predicted component of type VI protein secretion system
MVDITEEEYQAACERGQRLFETEPHAKSVRYNRKTKRMILELSNGATFAFSPSQVQYLQDATPEQLDAVEISGQGYGLHWEALDADYTVGGLLAGRFGTAAYMKMFPNSEAA